MALPSITSRYRVDNMVKNGIDGGFPVGSPEAKAAIDRVGRALHGKHWQPGGVAIHHKGWLYQPKTKAKERNE